MSEPDTTEFSVELPEEFHDPACGDEKFDVFVETDTNSRLIKLAIFEESRYTVTFSIEGGFPAAWYDDEFLDALAEKLGKNMHRHAEFLHDEP
jgi:hypothetical protein